RSLKCMEFIHQGFSERIQTVAIGCYNIDRRDLTRLGRTESVAGCALALVEGLAARGLGRVNWEGKGGRVQVQQKVRDFLEARRNYGLRRGADCHGGGVITLLELVV